MKLGRRVNKLSCSIFFSCDLQEWLINEKQLDVFGMKLPTGFQLIGQVVCICTWEMNVTALEQFNIVSTTLTLLYTLSDLFLCFYIIMALEHK